VQRGRLGIRASARGRMGRWRMSLAIYLLGRAGRPGYRVGLRMRMTFCLGGGGAERFDEGDGWSVRWLD
jgi:hypothetical protein